jgi:hypothetical protein
MAGARMLAQAPETPIVASDVEVKARVTLTAVLK